MDPVCFLDMDGVLVDFVAGAHKVHGKTYEYKSVTWEFMKHFGVSNNDFWAPMGFDFWADLPWTKEGPELLRGLERYFPESIVLMTSPCLTVGSVEGKVEWIRRNMPNYARKFFVGPAKHLAAGPGKVLIDDHDNNVDLFRLYGGNAVLIPRPWNRLADFAPDGHFVPDDILHEIEVRCLGGVVHGR